MLDTTETWTYTCQTNLTQTTTNTATASGQANGLTARDFAIATVVVAPTPTLPDTGVTPAARNILLGIIMFIGITIIASISITMAIRRKKI